jgi:hypothetical protein
MRILWTTVLAGTVIATATGVGVAKMQFQKNPLGQTPTQSQTNQRTAPTTLPSIDGQPTDPLDPMGPMREARRVRALASERQKKIIDDTSRLLQLATELNADGDKTVKEQGTDVARKLDEIEKLARDVKQRMKG